MLQNPSRQAVQKSANFSKKSSTEPIVDEARSHPVVQLCVVSLTGGAYADLPLSLAGSARYTPHPSSMNDEAEEE